MKRQWDTVLRTSLSFSKLSSCSRVLVGEFGPPLMLMGDEAVAVIFTFLFAACCCCCCCCVSLSTGRLRSFSSLPRAASFFASTWRTTWTSSASMRWTFRRHGPPPLLPLPCESDRFPSSLPRIGESRAATFHRHGSLLLRVWAFQRQTGAAQRLLPEDRGGDVHGRKRKLEKESR